MRLLLDECLPKRLKRAFPGFDISTVPEMGWAGVKDGVLLGFAVEAGFDVFTAFFIFVDALRALTSMKNTVCCYSLWSPMFNAKR